MPKWNPQPLKFIASSHIKLFYCNWFLMVWWPFERSSRRKHPIKLRILIWSTVTMYKIFLLRKRKHQQRGNISPEIPAGWRTVHGEWEFNFLQNCSFLIFPHSSQLLNFSYFFQMGTWWKPEHEVWRK